MRVLVIGARYRTALIYHFAMTALAMKNLGMDVTFITSKENKSNILLKLLLDSNVNLVDYKKIDSLKIKDILIGNILLNNILNDISPDIILAEGVKQLSKVFLFKKLNRKVIRVSIAGGIPPKNTKRYLGILDKVTDYTIALCLYTKKALLELGFDPTKIIVTPIFSPYLPLYDKWKSKQICLERYGLNNIKNPIIFYAAYHYPWKGFEYYLLAAKKVLQRHDATFIIGGSGPMTPYLKKLADKLGISKNVIFTGFIPPHDLYAMLYQVVDIAVSTSLKEQFPSYILEVMAANKPIVATNVAGVPEQVFDGFNGFLVKPRDYKSTAMKICELIEDDYLRKKMGANGRKIIERIYNRKHAVEILIKKLKK